MPLVLLTGFNRDDCGACEDRVVGSEGCSGVAGCGTEGAVKGRPGWEVENEVVLVSGLSREGARKESPPRLALAAVDITERQLRN